MSKKTDEQENPYLKAIEQNVLIKESDETEKTPLAPMPSSTSSIGPNIDPLTQEPFVAAPPPIYNDPEALLQQTDPMVLAEATSLPHDPQGDFESHAPLHETAPREKAKTEKPGPKSKTQNKTLGQPKKKAKTKSRSLKKRAMAEATSFALGKRPGPIVPKGTIAGHSLMLVIAIMSFLAALTVAAVSIVSDATRDWQSDISRGATIQIRQVDGVDIETELSKAITIARQTPGITTATVLSARASNALLEPWLGLDLAFDDLPIPRLIELTIDNPDTVDFEALSRSLQQQVTGAILDNHRFWVERLRSMAETAILVGFAILLLMIAATVLTVVFATRSAMSGNKETIEVLHFVGASNKFIASEFQSKFFTLGFKGAMAGGGAAMVIFLILQLLVREDEGSAALDQMQALLGVVDLGLTAYVGTFALVIVIAVFTAITTRLTVMNTLSKLS